MEKTAAYWKRVKAQVITRKEVADLLGVHPNTLTRKIQKTGYQLPPGRISRKHFIELAELLGASDLLKGR